MKEIKNQKKQLRRDMIAARNNMSQGEVIDKSRAVQNLIMQSPQYNQCQTLLVYINMGNEVMTSEIISDALGKNKRVGVPVCIPKTREMNFIEINSMENLVISKFGVPEPIFNEDLIIESDDKTLIIVPGLCFARDGFRVGYGGGYYDKYLSSHTAAARIGICYDLQIANHVPMWEYDIPVDIIISESGYTA